jgi:hypothetical protein
MKRFLFFEKIILTVLVFLLPTQLAIHFWPSWAFVFGIRIDYLSPAIYLTDILTFLVLGLWIVQDKQTIFNLIKKYKHVVVGLLLLILINSYFSVSIFPTLYKWLKILELISFGVYVNQRFKIVGKESILKTLFASIIFFSLIGIDQFITGHTIGGLLYWLGERSFTISTPGIALTNIFGQSSLRAYSTFPHPNALAGYLGASTIFLVANDFFKKNKKRLFGLLVITTCFLLTFSLTAFIAVVISFLLNKKSSAVLILIVLLSLLMPITSTRILSNTDFNKNISERLDLSILSGKIITQNFWTGTGVNTFIVEMTEIRPSQTSAWLLQPVHNIFLLVLSEVGIFGLLILVFYFFKSIKKFPYIFLFVILT